MPTPTANAPVLDISTANHRVEGRLGLQCFEHVGEQPLIVLQVGVHYRDVRCGARQDTLDAGGSKPATANPLNAAHSTIYTSKSANRFRRSILRVIIDKDRLPVDAFQCT